MSNEAVILPFQRGARHCNEALAKAWSHACRICSNLLIAVRGSQSSHQVASQSRTTASSPVEFGLFEGAMRIGLSVASVALGAAAFAAWFIPLSNETRLVDIGDVGAGGVAELRAPPANAPAARGGEASAASSAGLSRFFGFGLASQPASNNQPRQVDEATRKATANSAGSPSSWQTDVVIYPGAHEANEARAVAEPARVIATSTVQQSRDKPRHQMIRELQAELKRVGCYPGEIDGDWGSTSRRAWRVFAERTGTGLVGDEPDLVHLTLVKGYSGWACRSAPTPATIAGPAYTSGVTTATTDGSGFGPVLAPSRPQLAPSVPTFAGATGSIAASGQPPAAYSGQRQPPFEGRMTLGAPAPSSVRAEPPPPLTAAPAHRPPRVRAQSSQQQGKSNPRRRDRSWTATFFNQ